MAFREALNLDLDLFTFSDPLLNKAIRGRSNTSDYGMLEEYARGQLEPRSFRPEIRQDLGYTLLDVVWVSKVPLVSNRVIEVLKQVDASGWKSLPVEITLKNGEIVAEYNALAIVGRCESLHLDGAHSKVIYREYPMALVPQYQGLFVNSKGWDGSDLFRCADGKTDYVIVTDKVRSAFVSHKITNVEMRPVDQVEAAASELPELPLQLG
jgi:hypothetical protein